MVVFDDGQLNSAWSRALSPRERQIALLVARGLSNKEVAHELGLSHGTVKQHLHNIFLRLGAKRRYNLFVLVRPAKMREQAASS